MPVKRDPTVQKLLDAGEALYEALQENWDDDDRRVLAAVAAWADLRERVCR